VTHVTGEQLVDVDEAVVGQPGCADEFALLQHSVEALARLPGRQQLEAQPVRLGCGCRLAQPAPLRLAKQAEHARALEHRVRREARRRLA
jgi:hypothetical protein